MSDLDRLLGTNSMFRLGRWTEMARGIADEVSGTTEADRRWLELNNARTLITTWGDRSQSEGGGLRDYSYRQWNGMLADYYRPRWEKFFAGQSVNWFDNDRAFALNSSKSYSSAPVGDTRTIAAELLSKYMARFGSGFICRSMVNDFTAAEPVVAIRGLEFSLPMAGFSITVDGKALPAVIPANYPTGNFEAVAADANGTIVRFRIVVRDEVVNPRTVTVAVDDPSHGSAAIDGVSSPSVTSREPVTVSAVPASGYRFSYWSIDGEKVSVANPYIYYGATSVTLVANFTEANVIDAGGTKLYYDTNADGSLTVTGVASFNEDGRCYGWSDDYNVSAITADAFAGNTGLRSITLPGSCVSLKGLLHCGSYPGDGVQNRQIKLAEPIPVGASWGLRLRVANNGATFNQWGSGLLATGSDALGATYNGGVQFYLNKAGNIIVKTGSTEHKNLTTVVRSEFTLLALYDAAARRLTVRLVYPIEVMGMAYETEEYFTIENCQLNTISSFATAIPNGVDIQSLQVFPYRYTSDAFAGCRNLMDISIDRNWNRIFYGDDFTGILYNADHLEEIVAFPEGFLFENAFRLASGGKFLCADPVADASGEMIDRDRSVGTTKNLGASSMWRLASVGTNVKVELLNAGRFISGKPATGNRLDLPVSAGSYGEYDLDFTFSGSDLKMALRLADSDLYVGGDGNLSSSRVDFDVLIDNKIVLPDKVNLVSFPVPVCAADSTYFVTGLDGDVLSTVGVTTGAGIPANTGLLILGPATLYADYGLVKPTHALPYEEN
ncbi:MAG: alpha-N-acetylglucosaminidase C-terminal domain-containing protein, partial [Muribaculaceae bacterium]|nr:alpha-N-acetylglucosaminidase C-terminal domain-containing protein [Muribaculaceae bacterium]